MDDIDTCSIRGHEYGSLLNDRGGHICLNCGHVDEDYERPDEWQENDFEGWDDDTPNTEAHGRRSSTVQPLVGSLDGAE